MSSETKQEFEAFKRYEAVVEILRNLGDDRGLKLIQELVDKCARYLEVTSISEAYSKKLRSGKLAGGEDILDTQRVAENLDRNRKLAHDALISQVVIVNRYVSSKKGILPGGIYSLNYRDLTDPYSCDSRIKIGNWAECLVVALKRRGIFKAE